MEIEPKIEYKRDRRLKRWLKSEYFSLFFVITLSITLLAVKGNGIGHQGNFLNTLFGETSAYYEGGAIRTIDINSLVQSENIGPSAGGQSQDNEQYLLSATIQQNSILPYNTAVESLDDITSEEHQVTAYTVQEGDVLSLIARDFGVSTNSLTWANNLTNANSIRVGQELKIPPVSGVIHTVKSGDTVSSLAQRYGADTDEIISFNGLSEDGKLSIGLDIVIPGGEIQAIPSSNTPVRLAQTVPFANLPKIVGYYFHPTGGLGRISQWIHGRNGIDVANSCGTNIYAAADGVVSNALPSGWNGGYGNYVKISHPNGTSTLYAHMWTLSVSAGQSIAKGQKVGTMGTTGRSTGCHVHFEVHGAQNPLATR